MKKNVELTTMGEPTGFQRVQQPQSCPLLDLPQELRDQIYNFVYQPLEPDSIDLLTAKPPSLGLPSVCKQISNVTRTRANQDFKTYWQSNTFAIDAKPWQQQQQRQDDLIGPQPPLDFILHLITRIDLSSSSAWGTLRAFVRHESNSWDLTMMLSENDGETLREGILGCFNGRLRPDLCDVKGPLTHALVGKMMEMMELMANVVTDLVVKIEPLALTQGEQLPEIDL